jgi:hypothetical protein
MMRNYALCGSARVDGSSFEYGVTFVDTVHKYWRLGARIHAVKDLVLIWASKDLAELCLLKEKAGYAYFNPEDLYRVFKKSFTNLKAYTNLFRGHIQGFELSSCSKTHRVLPGGVTVQCDFHW